jgi:hypothetical protein
MPDPTLSAAIKEAYAVAPTNDVIYHTLELWQAVFAAPLRLVLDNADISAKIEATAARNPGAMVAFTAYAFNIVPPDQSATSLPQCTIEIDNVNRDILVQLDAAVFATGPVSLIYRAYLASDLTSGPENDPPLEMEITQISATPLRIRAVAGFANLLDKRFPALDYNLETFPGLLQ